MGRNGEVLLRFGSVVKTVNYFVDEYARVLDDKGRIVLPTKVREKLGDTVFITRAPADKCLYMYTEEEWGKLAEKLENLPTSTDRNAGAFVRMFFGKASACSIDKQGRISITPRLLKYAGLDKNIMLIGANNRLEIWDTETWDDYQDELSENVVLDGILKYDLNI